MHTLKSWIEDNRKTLFKSSDSRFQLITCLQVALIPLFAFSVTTYILWVFMSMTHVYFESNGLMASTDLKEAFFDSILSQTLYMIPYGGVFLTALFFLGHYISNLLLRPFKFISDYSIGVYQNPNNEFDPDYISEFKLPISFGIRFFGHLNHCRKEKTLRAVNIENRFAQINKPIFDMVFFINYTIFLTMACLIASWGLYLFTVDMHDRIVTLSLEVLKTNNASLVHFLNGQKQILENVILFSTVIMFTSYYLLGLSIVKKVNGVSYNFFKTMREFMNGNFNARINLKKDDPGHGYAKSLNKLLDHVMNEEISTIEWQKKDKVA